LSATERALYLVESMTIKERWQLPDGIEEILPDEARRLERLRRDALDLFAAWGYELVMPPLMEYIDSLLTGVGRELDLQTFKLIDQMTGRLLGIRADMTPQAARIDAHYLKRSVPVRLCYVGSVLRTRPDEFGGTREPLQLGAELYGHRGPESDAEILRLMLATLDTAGIADTHVDLGHVGVFRALAAYAGLVAEQEAEVFEALQRKARSEVAALLTAAEIASPSREWLLALLDLNGGPEVMDEARRLYQSAPDAVLDAIDELGAVAAPLRDVPRAPKLNFDLAELSGYHYYTGVVFSAFVPGQGRAVAKGGRYDGIGRAFGRSRAATGFGADLRQLLRLGNRADNPLTGILAPAAADRELDAEIARLRGQGERVVVQLPGDATGAADLGCDRRLVRKDKRWVAEKI
jgi:ATP phosphoribosyltransferase regulatory subunit